MANEARRQPYIWPTWISGLLSGDKQCQYAAWYRAHFYYEKLEDAGREESLSEWKTQHARAVSDYVDLLRSKGWTVQVEDENRFVYHGKAASVGGCPDIVAAKNQEVLVVDAKTGKKRESDAWQVRIYGALLPLVDERASELQLSGVVVYKDSLRQVSAQQMIESKEDVIKQIRHTAQQPAPLASPSYAECAMCDISTCMFRYKGEVRSATGEAF